MFNHNKNISEGEKVAHINGKYGLANTIVKAIIGAFGALGGSTVTVVAITIIINYTDYVSPRGEELLSQQDSEISNLQTQIVELQTQNSSLKEENQTLQSELDSALAELEGSSSSQMQASTPNTTPAQTTGTVTKLTALPLLGNNEDYYNHIYNNAENSEYARSNLGDVFNYSISLRENGNVDFFLDGKYQALTFTLCIAEETRDIDDYSSYIEIYSVEGNGETESTTLLYTSPSVTMGFIPESIGPVNVTGVNHLRITFFRPDTSPYNVPRIILGNPELT